MADTNSFVEDTRFLSVYSDKFILTSTHSRDQIRIDLATGSFKKEPSTTQGADEGSLIKKIGLKAIYGICELVKSKYLMVVTQSFLIGSIYGKNIQQLREIQFFPINVEQKVQKLDEKYIAMMQSVFDTKMFYFSDDYDLTNSFQTFIKNQLDKNKFNPNFCYNLCYLSNFIRYGCHEWVSPFISGFVKIEYTQIDNTQVAFILVSRRDKRRAGVRFFSRGTDLDGNPSNMAEQEQITLLMKGQMNTIYSFVQTRGSMPFLWTQRPDLKWAPQGKVVGDEADNLELCRKHFTDQEKLYSRQVLVNLIDKKGRTQPMLGQYFEKLVSKLKWKTLKYVWFDFHSECRNMKYENLSLLLDQFKFDLADIGYFEYSYSNDKNDQAFVKKLQKGTIRTNCMDCLDRTNVVQSVIARNVLHKILYSASVTDKMASTALEKFPDRLEEIFRANWTRNADVISILYTGTGALKTDFTRTGKRTKQGAIQDGINSVMRYVYGNFYDGHKQDCFDVLLGKYRLEDHPVRTEINPMFMLINYLLVAILVLKFKLSEHFDENASVLSSLLGYLVYILGLLVILAGTFHFHRFFVQKPIFTQQ